MNNVKIILFGSSRFIIPVIENLRKNFDLVMVITTEKNPGDSVPSFCQTNKIPFLSVTTLSDPKLKSSIINLKSPVAVLSYFGLFVPDSILNSFPKGIINIHPSLLPKYRGPTPVQTAILNGETTTGVTIIKLDSEIDHGKIFTQKTIEISEKDTTSTLHEKLFSLGGEQLIPIIKDYLNGSLKPQEQDHSNATFTKRLSRNDGYIDFNNPPSKEKLDRMIRAYHPWPGAWTKFKVKSSKLKVIKFLPDKKIQIEGKKPMSYKDFTNGYPEAKEKIERFF